MMNENGVNENQDTEKTVVTQASEAEATLLGTTVSCPVCVIENAPSEKYCGECGFLLSTAPGEAVSEIETKPQPKLIEADTEREHLIFPGENMVGRENTDVLISDPTVSRRHARIIVEEGKAWVEDMGSTNGSFINSQQIQPGEKTEVSSGAELTFGSVRFTLDISQPEVEEEITETEEALEEGLTDEEVFAEVEETDEEISELEPEPEEAVEEISPLAKIVSENGAEFNIVPGTNSIGRRAGNDIQITDDPYVSGAHAEINLADEKFTISDVGSTNGTIVNGVKIEPGDVTPLADGDEVAFGQSKFKFEVISESED